MIRNWTKKCDKRGSHISSKLHMIYIKKVKVKWSRYRPGVARRVGRGIALLFHDRGTRRGWVASSTPRPHFTPGKDPVPIVQEAGWAPGPVWTGGKSRPHLDSIPDCPSRSSVAIPTELPGPQMIYISSNNVRHPGTKNFTPPHYTSPNYTSLHFTTHVDTSLRPI